MNQREIAIQGRLEEILRDLNTPLVEDRPPLDLIGMRSQVNEIMIYLHREQEKKEKSK